MSALLTELANLVAVSAFALAGTLSLLAGVEPLYVVLRGIAAFLGTLFLCRWVVGLLEAWAPPWGPSPRDEDTASSGGPGPRG